MDLIDDLLFPDPSILSHMNILKQYLDIWLIPTANPEGLNVVHEELDFSYRKNKRDLSPEVLFPIMHLIMILLLVMILMAWI